MRLLLGLLMVGALWGQHVNLERNVTGALPIANGGTSGVTAAAARTALSTGYIQIQDTAPAACAVGDLWFDSNATAGQNWYGCTATNTWTLQSDTGIPAAHAASHATGQSDALSGTLAVAISGNASTASALAANPTGCTAAYVTDIAADGTLTCTQREYNVLAYGADGSDASEDDTEMQAALTAAGAAGGGVVWVPYNGTYYVDAGLSVPANVELRCAPGALIKAMNSANLSYVVLLNGSNSTVRGCILDGNTDNTGTNTTTAALVSVTAAVTHWKIIDNELRECGFAGIAINGDADYGLAQGNYIHDNGNASSGSGLLAGAWGGGRPENIRILGNIFIDNTWGGIGLDAIYVEAAHNYFYQNCNSGGQMGNMGDGGVARYFDYHHNTIVKGTCASGDQAGIEYGGSAGRFTNNHIVGFSDSGEAGIVIESINEYDAEDNIVADNIIMDCYMGVELLDAGTGAGEAHDTIISNNRIDADTGVWIDSGSTLISVLGNNFTGSTTAITDSGTGTLIRGNLPASVMDQYAGVAFSALGTPANGTVTYCSDCNADCTAGSSTGNFCKRLNGAWAVF